MLCIDDKADLYTVLCRWQDVAALLLITHVSTQLCFSCIFETSAWWNVGVKIFQRIEAVCSLFGTSINHVMLSCLWFCYKAKKICFFFDAIAYVCVTVVSWIEWWLLVINSLFYLHIFVWFAVGVSSCLCIFVIAYCECLYAESSWENLFAVFFGFIVCSVPAYITGAHSTMKSLIYAVFENFIVYCYFAAFWLLLFMSVRFCILLGKGFRSIFTVVFIQGWSISRNYFWLRKVN